MTTPVYFLIAAVLHATIPVVILVLGDNALNNAISVTGTIIVISVFVTVFYAGRASVRAALKDIWLVLYAALSALGYFGFLYLFAVSKSVANPIYALVIVESWPIFTAILFPLVRIGRTSRLSLFEYIVGALALTGLVLVSGPAGSQGTFLDVDLAGIMAPVLAMLAMALAATMKALHVQRAKRTYGIGPVLSYFLLYLPIAPVLPFLLLGHDGGTSFALTAETLLLPAVITLLSIGNAVAFSYGTLKISRSTDLYIWFFTPVFSTLFFCLFTATLLTPLEAAGIGVIVGCNLLASLETEKRYGYRYGVAGLMVTGVICITLQPLAMTQYYDTLAVLVIFVTITLAFLLERVSTRAGQEATLYSTAYTRAMALGDKRLRTALQAIITERAPSRLKRKARRITALTDDAQIVEPVALICASRLRGLSVSNLFSIAFGLFAASVIAVTSRPVGWQHDLFAFCFIPSLLYGFFYLVDLNAQRFTLPYYAYDHGDGTRISFTFDKAAHLKQNSIWSIILILFLSLCFLYGFAMKHSVDAPYLLTF